MEAMRAEERRALAEREEIERLRVINEINESDERNRRLEEEINKLKALQNLDIKRRMLVSSSSSATKRFSLEGYDGKVHEERREGDPATELR